MNSNYNVTLLNRALTVDSENISKLSDEVLIDYIRESIIQVGRLAQPVSSSNLVSACNELYKRGIIKLDYFKSIDNFKKSQVYMPDREEVSQYSNFVINTIIVADNSDDMDYIKDLKSNQEYAKAVVNNILLSNNDGNLRIQGYPLTSSLIKDMVSNTPNEFIISSLKKAKELNLYVTEWFLISLLHDRIEKSEYETILEDFIKRIIEIRSIPQFINSLDLVDSNINLVYKHLDKDNSILREILINRHFTRKGLDSESLKHLLLLEYDYIIKYIEDDKHKSDLILGDVTANTLNNMDFDLTEEESVKISKVLRTYRFAMNVNLLRYKAFLENIGVCKLCSNGNINEEAYENIKHSLNSSELISLLPKHIKTKSELERYISLLKTPSRMSALLLTTLLHRCNTSESMTALLHSFKDVRNAWYTTPTLIVNTIEPSSLEQFVTIECINHISCFILGNQNNSYKLADIIRNKFSKEEINAYIKENLRRIPTRTVGMYYDILDDELKLTVNPRNLNK